jgi:uncharacterized membrane protein YkoI
MFWLLSKSGVRLLLAILVLAAPVTGRAFADDGGYEDRAESSEHERDDDRHQRNALRGAVERGEAKSLSEILRIVQAGHPGEIVDIEVEFKETRWIYEVRVAGSDGRLIEVYVDAATGSIIKTEEK